MARDVYQNHSLNYYGEILFDQLELYYKHVLLEEIEVETRKKEIVKRAELGEVSKEVSERFVLYNRSVVLRRQMIQKQIDYYADFIQTINLFMESNSKALGNISSLPRLRGNTRLPSLVSSEVTLIETKEKIEEVAAQYIKLIQLLNEREDENELQQRYFENNFRCKSFK